MSEHTARHPRPLPSLQCVQRGPQVHVDGQAVPVGGQGRGGEGVPAGTAKEGKGVKDLTGQTFGRWTVAGLDRSTKKKSRGWHHYWRVRCRCGVERTVNQDDLKRGKSQSCGCLNRERMAEGRRRRQEGQLSPVPWNLARCPYSSGSIKWGADMQYNPMGGEWVEAA
jgi:hypothetical protein